MQDYITLYDGKGAFLGRIREVIDAQYTDRITGELTLSFTTKINRIPAISADTLIEFKGQYFRAVQTQSSAADGAYLLSVSCEQESVALVDDEIELFDFEGTPQTGLLRLLSGTGVSAESEFTQEISVREENTNRRAVVLVIAGVCGAEIEYSGHAVRLVRHRGRSSPAGNLLDILDCTDVVKTADVRSGVESYEISGAKPEGISVGDEVYVTFGPLGIAVQKRIIGISYNPFNCTSVSVEVGEFVPDIIEGYSKAAEEAENAAERVEKVEESLSGYVKEETLDSKVSASFDKYVNSETGKASIVASLKGTYVSADTLGSYVQKTDLSAEIGAYIDTQAGTAKIVNKLTGTFAKTNDLTGYLEKTQLNAGIETYINTASGQARIVSACSGTYQRKDAMSDYVTTTKLDTNIAQYIDSTTGKAKIVTACSGTYAKTSDLTGYATKTEVSTEISQEISDVEGKISLSASYGSGTIGSNVRALLQLVTNADSSTIKIKGDKVEIDGDLYLKSSDFLVAGTTTIKGSKISTTDLYIQQLRTTNGDYILDYYGNILAIGGGTNGSGHTFSQFDYIDMVARNGIRIGWASGYDLILEYANYAFTLRPYSATTTFNIGNVSYPVNSIRCKELYVGGVKITGSSSSSTTTLKETDIKKIYAASSTTDYIQLNSSKVFAPSGSGFDLGSTTYPFETLYVGSSSYRWSITSSGIIPNSTSSAYFDIGSSSYPIRNLYVGSSSSYHWKINADGIIPSTSSTAYFDIGSSYCPVANLYAKNIYLNGKALTSGGSSSSSSGASFAGQNVTMGGNSSYYIVCNTSRELRPYSSSTLYPCYLGTSSYFWQYAYIGSAAAYIGYSTSSKIGFFGATPVVKQTVSSSASISTLIAALQKYGLV